MGYFCTTDIFFPAGHWIRILTLAVAVERKTNVVSTHSKIHGIPPPPYIGSSQTGLPVGKGKIPTPMRSNL